MVARQGEEDEEEGEAAAAVVVEADGALDLVVAAVSVVVMVAVAARRTAGGSRRSRGTQTRATALAVPPSGSRLSHEVRQLVASSSQCTWHHVKRLGGKLFGS